MERVLISTSTREMIRVGSEVPGKIAGFKLASKADARNR
jgi:hypothetical protein